MDQNTLLPLIKNFFEEDVKEGDHSSLSTIPKDAKRKARLIVKDDGVIAGIELAKIIFNYFDADLKIESFNVDGDAVKFGDIAFTVEGNARSLLTTERIVLNCMQRMSGIATMTKKYSDLVKDLPVKLLDTRKTTPGIRILEKWAVRIGGGNNHRMGLYDMIMIKDNHHDYCGGITEAIKSANAYLRERDLSIKIEIEVRNKKELEEVLAIGQVDRIMLDNFSPDEIKAVLPLIPENYETEASGGITLKTLRSYGETGVDFISVGALTHSFKSLDMSLKAI